MFMQNFSRQLDDADVTGSNITRLHRTWQASDTGEMHFTPLLCLRATGRVPEDLHTPSGCQHVELEGEILIVCGDPGVANDCGH